jgi:hypothetical protein
MTYQEPDRVLLEDMTTTGEHDMTIEATIAAHTDGAAEALVEQITRPSAGHRLDVDPREVERDIDAAIAATRSTLGRLTRSGAALRVK